MKTILKLLVISIGLNAMSCTDRTAREIYTPQLPPITQTGANTFGAIINGRVMIPRNSIGYQPPGPNTHYAIKYVNADDYNLITASNSREYNIGDVYIFLRKTTINTNLPVSSYPILEGVYSFNMDELPDYMIRVIINDNNTTFKTYLSIANTGSIILTRNDSNIISGTFSCKLKNKENPEDIIEVKDGRFDFNKQTINTTNFP
ncbi:hypothetical protein JSO59_004260 [Riemerella anatipestifer]|uniref:hypothetical protein n=1 Tax=Riemerella anatipestifer TaxID=34085 RepID=UPI0030C0E1F4